jgi:hypothetical protein
MNGRIIYNSRHTKWEFYTVITSTINIFQWTIHIFKTRCLRRCISKFVLMFIYRRFSSDVVKLMNEQQKYYTGSIQIIFPFFIISKHVSNKKCGYWWDLYFILLVVLYYVMFFFSENRVSFWAAYTDTKSDSRINVRCGPQILNLTRDWVLS